MAKTKGKLDIISWWYSRTLSCATTYLKHVLSHSEYTKNFQWKHVATRDNGGYTW